METYLHVGGVVAAGFDSTGRYLLVVSHSGRGVFSVTDWKRVARDDSLAYPEGGIAVGIGPIANERIPITEMNHSTGRFAVRSSDARITLECESSGIAVKVT